MIRGVKREYVGPKSCMTEGYKILCDLEKGNEKRQYVLVMLNKQSF